MVKLPELPLDISMDSLNARRLKHSHGVKCECPARRRDLVMQIVCQFAGLGAGQVTTDAQVFSVSPCR